MTSSKTFFRNCISEEMLWKKGVPIQESIGQCKKNQHNEFHTIEDMQQKIPTEFADDVNLMEQLTLMAHLTVHINTKRDDSNYCCGSGFIQRVRKESGMICPWKKCVQEKRRHTWGIVTMTTVFHVIKTQQEAEDSVILIDYNSDSSESKTVFGVKLLETEKETNFDWCAVECITHEEELLRDLITTIDRWEEVQKLTYQRYKGSQCKLTVMIGHPHGGIKKVSFGEYQDKKTLKEVRSTQNWCLYTHTTRSCPGSSGSPVFILGQPLCGFGYWFGHPHNHSGWDYEKKVAMTSIGAESITVVAEEDCVTEATSVDTDDKGEHH